MKVVENFLKENEVETSAALMRTQWSVGVGHNSTSSFPIVSIRG